MCWDLKTFDFYYSSLVQFEIRLKKYLKYKKKLCCVLLKKKNTKRNYEKITFFLGDNKNTAEKLTFWMSFLRVGYTRERKIMEKCHLAYFAY